MLNNSYSYSYSPMHNNYQNTPTTQQYISPTQISSNQYTLQQQNKIPDYRSLKEWKLFRIEKLQNDLIAYQREVNNQISLKAGLASRLKYLQKYLESQPNVHNKSIIDSFQTQLDHFNSRVNLSKSLVNKLASFFSVLLNDQEEAANKKAVRKKPSNNKQMSQPISSNKLSTPLQTSTNAFNNSNNAAYSSLNSTELNLDNLSYSHGLDLLSNFSLGIDENDMTTSSGRRNTVSAFNSPYDLSDVVIPTNETTENIAYKIREHLLINNISQKKFAENLLHMKQTNFNALMAQPLSWHTLTKTNRERFLTMYTWLNDPNRVERLNELANNEPAANIASSLSQTNGGKQRVLMTKEQTDRLRGYFMRNPYPTSDEAEKLALELGFTQKKILNWFTNQRQSNKRKF